MSSTRNIVIFGIDNVIRDSHWRYNLIPIGRAQQTPENWAAFHAAGKRDEPIKPMLHMLHMYAHDSDYEVYFWANIMEEYRDDVRNWLSHHGILGNAYKQLFLRPDGVRLPTKEVYERWLKGMPESELARVKIVVSADEDLIDVFAPTKVDTLKLNGVSAF